MKLFEESKQREKESKARKKVKTKRRRRRRRRRSRRRRRKRRGHTHQDIRCQFFGVPYPGHVERPELRVHSSLPRTSEWSFSVSRIFIFYFFIIKNIY